MKNKIIGLSIFLCIVAACSPVQPQRNNTETKRANKVQVLEEKGGRLSLSPDGAMIAYDKRGKGGFYDVWTMAVDGSQKRCFTCGISGLPTRNVGQPEWHPSGKYLVVQAEKQIHPVGIATKVSANPGAGVFNDLWIIEVATKRVWRIHEVPNTKHTGVLHPHFSKDGKRLSWSEIYRATKLTDPALLAGSWNLKVADFKVDKSGVPSLTDIETFQPGDEVFYENHGFSPDGSKLIFTSNLKKDQSLFTCDIYTMDLATKELTRLTDTGYNEHGQYSPDGKKIVWMSTNGNIEPKDVNEVSYTDWWIMNADGTDKRRVTYFNDKGHPHFVIWGTVAADFDWAPDGMSIYGYYHTLTIKNLLTGKFREAVVEVEIE